LLWSGSEYFTNVREKDPSKSVNAQLEPDPFLIGIRRQVRRRGLLKATKAAGQAASDQITRLVREKDLGTVVKSEKKFCVHLFLLRVGRPLGVVPLVGVVE